MKKLLVPAISVLALSGIIQAHAASSGLAAVERPATAGTIVSSPVAYKVKKIIVEHLGVEESKVTPEASFIDDLGADSLDTVELVMAVEEAFGVEIPEDAPRRSTL